MAKFEVKFQMVVYSYKTFIVEAEDPIEAEELGTNLLEGNKDSGWEEGEDSDVELQSVEEITEGES